MDKEELRKQLTELNEAGQLPKHLTDEEIEKVIESELNGDHSSCPLAEFEGYTTEKPKKEVKKPTLDLNNTGHGISYTKEALTEFWHPQNLNVDENDNFIYKDTDPDVIKGEFGTLTACGDQVDVWVKLNPEHTIIEDMKYLSTGCLGCISSCSKTSEYVKGMKVSDFNVKEMMDKVQNYLNLPAIKHHCASYAGLAIDLALKKLK